MAKIIYIDTPMFTWDHKEEKIVNRRLYEGADYTTELLEEETPEGLTYKLKTTYLPHINPDWEVFRCQTYGCRSDQVDQNYYSKDRFLIEFMEKHNDAKYIIFYMQDDDKHITDQHCQISESTMKEVMFYRIRAFII